MRADLDWLPSPPELDRAPECAVLAAIRAVLPVVSYALLAATPELADDDPRPPFAVAHAARTLLTDLDRLRISIDHYRSVVATLSPPAIPIDDQDFPF